jgi:hypothetical protein
VCGKVVAYQADTVDGFSTYSPARGSGVDSNYVDGVSLTHGSAPRNHIWTFATGPCPGSPPPTFVGSDYFIDVSNRINSLNLHNPVWDGVGCGTNTCCRQNNPPWFHKQLPRTTTDDIEMRVCRDQVRGDEDVAIKLMEIYVK